MPTSPDHRTRDPRPWKHERETTSPEGRKVIRSDRIRYPGVEERIGADGDPGRTESRRRLRPARDAGMSIERRHARQSRRAAQARINRALAAGAGVVLLLLLTLGWQWASDRGAAQQVLPGRASAQGTAVFSAIEPQAEPTPLFASRGSLKLRLPVAVDDLTEVGFHQASYGYALPMQTTMPDADMTAAKRNKGTGRDIAAQDGGDDAVLVGGVLRMWRDRPGQPDTAVDIGAKAGAQVLSPVDGTVVLVKRYKLYDEHDDYQIHVRPDGAPRIDCVLIHIEKPTVKAGDRVMAGISPLGSVRLLSDRINHQLRSYAPYGGDHVHMQLNDARHPDYKGLKGAIQVSGS